MADLNRFRRGQSLVEILIAVAVGVILVGGALTIISPTLKTGGDAARLQVAAALGRELMENVRSMGEGGWHTLDLATTSANRYFLHTSPSPFTVASGTESIVLPDISSNLLAYWRFEEGTASTTLNFASSSMNALLYNDVSWTSGYLQKGLLFGGVTNQVIPQNSSSLKYQGGDMTVSLWFRPDSTDDGGFLISKPWNGSGQYNWNLKSLGGASPTLRLQIMGSASTYIDANKGASGEVWHHALFTLASSSKMYLYLDGTVVASSTYSIPSWTPPAGDGNSNAVMGCIYPYGTPACAGATTYAYKGALDDVRVYNRVLSAGEIANLYRSTAFNRYFYLDNVYRNGSGKIDSTGIFDPSTKKITVVYGWASTTASSTSYLSRTNDAVFVQNDWSGGGNQNGPQTATSVNAKFATSSNIDYSTSTGSIVISGM